MCQVLLLTLFIALFIINHKVQAQDYLQVKCSNLYDFIKSNNETKALYALQDCIQTNDVHNINIHAFSKSNEINPSRNTPLIAAVIYKMNYLALKLIKTNHSTPEYVNIHYWTALEFACIFNMSDVALALVKTNQSMYAHVRPKYGYRLAAKKKILYHLDEAKTLPTAIEEAITYRMDVVVNEILNLGYNNILNTFHIESIRYKVTHNDENTMPKTMETLKNIPYDHMAYRSTLDDVNLSDGFSVLMCIITFITYNVIGFYAQPLDACVYKIILLTFLLCIITRNAYQNILNETITDIEWELFWMDYIPFVMFYFVWFCVVRTQNETEFYKKND